MDSAPRSASSARSGWDRSTLRAPHTQPDKAHRVEAMFDAIAPTYERVNALASLGRDRAWRRAAIAAAAVRAGDVVLDVCCGTGDMIREIAASRPSPRVIVGIDFSSQMLNCGRYQQNGVEVQLVRADALRLPLANASVDVITCAFGVRNFQRLQEGLNEMGRVARPGARLAILEFTKPESPLLRWGHQLYTELILPRLGRWLSGDRTRAYEYLPKSIQCFETRRSMRRRIEDAGFARVSERLLNLGSVVVYRGERADSLAAGGL